MEAVVAAVYLDAGLEAARGVILKHWAARIGSVKADARDAKTALQEWAQARKKPIPNYEVIERTGPDHAPQFTVQVSVDGEAPEQASGASRRSAEKQAAQTLYDKLIAKDKKKTTK